MKTLIIAGIVLLLYMVWQIIELKLFKITEYEMISPKVSKEYAFAVLADLHGFCYGTLNKRVLHAVRRQHPDAILIPGDMIVRKKPKTYKTAGELFDGIGPAVPMYYSYGNHEQRAKLPSSPQYEKYTEYEKQTREGAVHILDNETEKLSDEVEISGLTIPLSCYKKGKSVPLPKGYLEEHLPKPESGSGTFRILLAHNPAYAEQYAAWGADLTVCGHNHGGLIRIPCVGSLISPQFKLFPKYAEGEYTIDGQKVIVSRGMGTHTFHIRIFNRAELVVIRIKPQDIADGPQKNSKIY